jgi:hypothetical protein
MFWLIAVALGALCMWLLLQARPNTQRSSGLDLRPGTRGAAPPNAVKSLPQLAEPLELALPIDATALNKGDRVRHETFQSGTVLALDHQHIVIDFDIHGRRTLSSAHVRLYSARSADAMPLAAAIRQVNYEHLQERHRADYEREFPYDEPPDRKGPVERLSRRSPTVSGGLPSLGKRR